MPIAQNPLETPLREIPGVGTERAGQLRRLELQTVGDLLLHRPRRYEDRRRFQRIAGLQLGEPALTRGRIIASGARRGRRGGRSLFEFVMDDGSARLHCRWWNLPFMEKYFKVGDEAVVFGRPVSLRPRTIDHPETEVITALENSLHLNRIVPIYPLTEGLPQRWLRSLVWRLLGEFAGAIGEPRPELKLAGSFPSRAEALRQIHFPVETGDSETARQRLALDEFIELQRAIQIRRKNLESKARAIPCAGNNRLIKPFLAALGFHLTDSQATVLREIRHDMAGPSPMRRLLQGDVGSGKTIVAACTVLMALESGANAALMAPTEILAEQHWRNFRRWLEPLGIAVEIRRGGMKTGVETGQEELGLQKPGALPLKMSVGTHALLEEGFAPERLGLVIIDEQHKFGVAQREHLVRKGAYPHLLVMTATPIPRTLGLTLYGDLDISVLGQGPAGRGRIRTFVRDFSSLPKVWQFLTKQLSKGRQAYIVYSRLEEGDSAAGVKAVEKEFHHLEKTFAPWRAGLLHGRLKSEEKNRVMAAFNANTVQVLLATSVVEVGLDVPNATVMVIQNAEQFGLAQLHQLRGRIGRGSEESFCILIASGKSEESRQRLKIMEETSDGFRIAEADLLLRGPGEFLGSQQSGAPPLRFGNLSGDIALIERARELVREHLVSQ
ncbi:MAG TPA: ATP-dependent DNA helicase RecG [Candidatus Baltobacteraceae bacterium]|nr:ATP-dependent DNA helicase RecG [Candidatus Baltobacteraceae bacterium]